MKVKIRPPRHLSDESRLWFASVLKDYDLEPHHVRLLRAACESWDRAAQAREQLAKEGITFTDRHGAVRPHPCCNIERDHRALFAKMLRELALDIEEPGDSRPPTIRGSAALRNGSEG
jgi:P27 family predicted phage terminase small subunit